MKSQQARTNVCGKLGSVNLYLTNTDPCQLNQSQMSNTKPTRTLLQTMLGSSYIGSTVPETANSPLPGLPRLLIRECPTDRPFSQIQ